MGGPNYRNGPDCAGRAYLQKLLCTLNARFHFHFELDISTLATIPMIFDLCGFKAYLFSQSVVRLTEESEVPGSITGLEHTFEEIDHETFSTIILPLPLIQKEQLSVTGERLFTQY